MIKRITITGADNSIQVEQLISLSKQYPFVEWGILVSRKCMGEHRFPSHAWLQELAEKAEGKGLNLSLHLCGGYVRELLKGEANFIEEIGANVISLFQRVQINTHGEPHEFDTSFVPLMIAMEKEFIFQYDNVNTGALVAAMDLGVYCSTLFDLSHGAGVLPANWPKPLIGVRCGYAGGISPGNIEEQILKVNEVSAGLQTWIDMETHVRTNELFDIAKVRDCLDIAAQYIPHAGLAKGPVTLTPPQRLFAENIGAKVIVGGGHYGINMGLYFPEGVFEPIGVSVYMPDLKKNFTEKFQYVKLVETTPEVLTGSEAIYGFAGWLTTRKQATILGGSFDAAPVAELVKLYCEVSRLPEIREDWKDYVAKAEGMAKLHDTDASVSTILYKAIPVSERLPAGIRETGPKIVPVLIDGRMEMMAQCVGFGEGKDWRTLGLGTMDYIQPTHWLERQ